jgi:hypothetical protein
MRAPIIVAIAALSATGGAIVGFAGARARRHGGATDDADRRPSVEPGRVVCSASVDPALLRSELRAALAELQRGSLPAAAPATTAPPPLAAAAEPSRDEVQTEDLARGRRLLADAVASHRWRAADAQAFRGLLPALPPDRREELVRTLVAAVNGGQLVPDADAALF